MPLRALLLVLLTVTLLVPVLAAPASAARSVSVSPKSIPRGGTLVVTGRGWPKNVSVQLLIGPPRSEADPVGSARTDGSGRFRRALRVDRAAGPAVLLGCRRECRDKAAATFRVFAVSFTG